MTAARMAWQARCTLLARFAAVGLLQLVLPGGTPRLLAATVTGTVLDAATGLTLESARIALLGPGGRLVAGAWSDARGGFRLERIGAGVYALAASRTGYERTRRDSLQLTDTDSLRLEIRLTPDLIRIDPIVVTASRRPERMLASPASVTTLGTRTIAERATITPIAHFRAIAGLDVAATGLAQSTVVARGFGSAQSAALLPLTDYRYTSIPSLRYCLFHFQPTPDEDIDRIEIVRGPGAAAYGPNSDRGVVHILTRSPFDAPGTAISVASGEREIGRASLRQAMRLGDRWAFKVAGQYFRGRDWPDVDSVEADARARAIAGGAEPETLRTGRRDPWNERVGGEATLGWRPAAGTELAASGGINRTFHSVELSALGAVQASGWNSSYAQLRGTHGELFAQAFVNLSHSGETYFLRSGQPVVDESRFWAAQIQRTHSPSSTVTLSYGLDGQWTDPRTGGTIMGRNEEHDGIRESGAYAHATVHLNERLDAVGALRVDDHSRLPDLVASPRAALSFTPRPNQNLRITYNRAYGTPATDDFFADLAVGVVDPNLPYQVRVEGIPEGGYTFPHENGVPLMRSPFTPSSAGGPAAYLPADATLLWDAAVAILQANGTDLSGVTPPSASDVRTNLALLNLDKTLTAAPDPRDIPALRPSITNTLEAGYRGLIGGRARVSIDVYRTRIEDFIGHLRTITPNVFLDRPTLAAYLVQQGLSPGAADSAATAASQIPLATLTPREARDPYDLIAAVQNFGSVAVWGTDLAVAVDLSEGWTLSGTYSWVDNDYFPGRAGSPDLALNAPGRKGSATLAYRRADDAWRAELHFRATASFPILSGDYSGTLDSYDLFDASAGLRLSTAPKTTLAVSAENLFDHSHREFLGAPRLGRLVVARLKTEF
jgi:outer membrane receptor for ferrienterochelin and colicins